jgi:hypothetical protein
MHIVYRRVFENRARARTFVQGAWREFGYVYLLRSAASVGPAEFRRYARERRLSELVVGSRERAPSRNRRAGTGCAPSPGPRSRPTTATARTRCARRCAGAFWKRALDILLERADLVVLDLPGYQEHYRGTQFELQRIVDTVPAEKVLLLADPWSRTRFLTEQVRLAWSRMAARSPNAGRGQLVLRGAVTDYFHREQSSSSGSSGSERPDQTPSAGRTTGPRALSRRAGRGRPRGMTSSQHPIDPTTVAEIAPGEGPEPGSVEYGGSEIHADGAGEDASTEAGGAVTTAAGTFEDLPVTPDEQVE